MIGTSTSIHLWHYRSDWTDQFTGKSCQIAGSQEHTLTYIDNDTMVDDMCSTDKYKTMCHATIYKHYTVIYVNTDKLNWSDLYMCI